MGLGFCYFSLPRPYVYLLELICYIRFLISLTTRRYGLHARVDKQNAVTRSSDVKSGLPVVGFASNLERRGADYGDHMCAICLSCLNGGDEVRELSSCSHAFHRACIDGWLDQGAVSCPLCRSELASEVTSTDL